MMRAFFNFLQERWSIISQVTAWMLGIICVFILPPAVINVTDQPASMKTTAFLVGSVLALAIIPIQRRSRRLHYRFWFRLAIVLFVFQVVGIGTYQYLREQWTWNNYGVQLVVGDDLLPEAELQRKKLEAARGVMIPTRKFVDYAPGQNDLLWEKSVLQTRLYTLRSLYVMTIILISGFLITVLQAIYCHERRT